MTLDLAATRTLLTEYANAYYEGAPMVPDETFDALLADYLAAGGEEIVGHGHVPAGRKVRHEVFMGSLKKVRADIDDLCAWMNSVAEFYRENADTSVPLRFDFSPKFDGLAVAVTVKDGKVTQVATRGDGTTGEDVTEIAKVIPGIASLTKDGIYQGEVMLPAVNLAAANALRPDDDAPLTQLRNAAAGIIRRLVSRKPGETDAAHAQRKEAALDSARLLRFFDHSGAESLIASSDYDDLTPEVIKVILDPIETSQAALPVTLDGETIEVVTDGVVIKVANEDVRAGLGYSSGSPRWARAYKFADVQHASTVTGVTWGAPGKIGRVTPVITYAPIEIDGGVYTRATAHNLTQYKALDPRLGDEITVIKAGQVIPYVVSITHKDGPAFLIPTTCPTCSAALVEEGEYLICTNDRTSCDPVGALTLIITGLGIKGIAYKVVERLYGAVLGNFSDMHDALAYLRSCPQGTIADIDGMGEKSETFIKSALNTAWQEAPLAAWIYGLNIDRVGTTVSEALVSTYGSLDGIIAAIDDPTKYREAQHLKGVNWQGVVGGRDRLVALRDFIAAQGIAAPASVVVATHDDEKWSGKKVALTGTLPISRDEATRWLKSRGALISSSFDILIDAGDGTSTKSRKAASAGKTVVTGEEFMADYAGDD